MSWLFLVVIGLVIVGIWMWKRPDIDSTAAHELVAKGGRLVDVRTPGEFAAGHLSGARNIPLYELGGRLGELEPKDGPIVLYCASGTRSAMAKRTLKRAGFTGVHNLGSMASW